jgi:asparagine synthase (glutamine-hydrolysing)
MEAMHERGRNGSATWQEGAAALGHQMTHITPESLRENLPFSDTRSSTAITADARLDNRQELFDALGVPFTNRSELPDSQLILRAYLKWGEECPSHLLGDFAFAIWDGRSRTLFCARDIIGTKPFYYFARSGWFAFATDIAALLNAPGVPRELDLSVVRAYLEQGMHFHHRRTFWQGMRKLPPAHVMVVSRRGLRDAAYWRPAAGEVLRYAREEDYLSHLLELVQEAVCCRLRCAVPMGSHCSGGLDSSTITTLAANMLREKARTLEAFSWSPPPSAEEYPLQDERALVEMVCKQVGISPNYMRLNGEDVVASVSMDIKTRPDETWIFEQVVSRMARERGIRVILSGWGGDEMTTFNGRGYFAELFLKGRWLTLQQELRARCALHNDSFCGSVRSRVVRPLLPDWVLSQLKPDATDLPHIMPLPPYLEPTFADQLRNADKLEGTRPARERPGVHRNQIDLLNHGHITSRLESWAANGALCGIEYWYPMLDRRLIEFSLSVPPHLFFKNGWKRYMFRQMTKGMLPAPVSWEKRKGDTSMIQGFNSAWSEAWEPIREITRSRVPTMRVGHYLNADAFANVLSSNPQYDQSSVRVVARALSLSFLLDAEEAIG